MIHPPYSRRRYAGPTMKNFIYGLGLGLVAIIAVAAAQDETAEDEDALVRSRGSP